MVENKSPSFEFKGLIFWISMQAMIQSESSHDAYWPQLCSVGKT
jgi:hypothetical protein